MRLLFVLFSLQFSFQMLIAQTSVIDIDGNIYEIVKIGEQYWFKENLKTFRYSNGDTIPNIPDYLEWSTLTTGSCCSYNNDTSNISTYGLLYNYYTVADSRNVCPDGWHVPSITDWSLLKDFLGGVTVAGGKMKLYDTLYWSPPNIGATNESGFSALPGGYRTGTGGFSFKGLIGFWWSSTLDEDDISWHRAIYNSSTNLDRGSHGPNSKAHGYSIRCVRDNTTTIKGRNYINEIVLYPNPVKDYLNIICLGSDELKMEIININGKLMQHIILKSSNEKINLTNLKTGIYFLRFKIGEDTIITKFIKQL